MKKIIGYKLNGTVSAADAGKFFGIDSYIYDNGCFLVSNDIVSIDKAQDAKVLDIWFDAVYEDEYKVGDYIYVLGDGGNNTNHPMYKAAAHVGDVIRVDLIGAPNGNTKSNFKVAISDEGHVLYIDQYPNYFRKATQQEIDKHNGVQILGHRMEVSESNVKFGCKSYPKEHIKQLYKLMSLYGISYLPIEEGIVHLKDIEKIYKKIS